MERNEKTMTGEMCDPIGVEDYGYPKADFMEEGWVRVTLGWFFPDLDPDESAYYIEYHFDKNGKGRFEVELCGFHFDFWTPLKEYGYRNHQGDWLYCDGHIPFSFKHWRFRVKVRLQNWARYHIPLLRRFLNWRYQRYCRKLLETEG